MTRRRLPRSLWVTTFLFFFISTASSTERSQAQIDKEIGEIVDLFLDLQFDKAEAATARLKSEYPGHPAGDFYHSMVLYQRILMSNKQPLDAVEAYEDFNRRCVASAEAYRAKDPAAADLFLSAAYGMHSRVYALEKRYKEAVKQALKSTQHIKASIKLRPDRDDSYLGLGVFNYFMSQVPSPVKPLLYFLVGSWGNRDLGLLEIERVADKGVANRMEARAILSAIYSSEKEQQWEKSDALLAELMERHPHNPLHRLRRIFVNERRGRFDLALKLADPDGNWVKVLPSSVRESALASAHYRTAEALLLSGKAAEGLPHLEALSSARLGERLTAWAALRRGNILDARGRKAEAEAVYRSLRHGEASAEAKEFLSQGLSGGPKTIMPFSDGIGLIR